MGACQDAAAYFSDSATACAVCLAESGGKVDNVGDGGTSYGLFQIHAPAHPDFDVSRAFDPTYNAQYAAKLQASSGWGPWTTFNTGAYKDKLGQCGGSSSSSSVSLMPSLPSVGAIPGSALGIAALLLGSVLLLQKL